jgi:HSP20 family protein
VLQGSGQPGITAIRRPRRRVVPGREDLRNAGRNSPASADPRRHSVRRSRLGAGYGLCVLDPMARTGHSGGEVMLTKKGTALARQNAPREPFALLREMATEFDKMFGDWPAFGWATLPKPVFENAAFAPAIDVFQKDGRLITRIDLPGMKKEDIKVEVEDGYLAISGERKNEIEEKKDTYYRCERNYGTFYRAVPLPDGVKVDDVKATFADGVLEVSVPLPMAVKPEPKKIEILEAGQPPKAA